MPKFGGASGGAAGSIVLDGASGNPTLYGLPARSDVADAADWLTTPATGWTLRNTGGGLTSLASSGGVLTFTFNTTSVKWYTDAQTAPLAYKLVYPSPRLVRLVAFVKTNSDANFEYIRLLAASSSAPATYTGIGVGYDATGHSIRSVHNGSNATQTTVTAQQKADGIWLLLEMDATSCRTAFKIGGARPTAQSDWTHDNYTSMTAAPRWVGIQAQDENTDGNHVCSAEEVDFSYLDGAGLWVE